MLCIDDFGTGYSSLSYLHRCRSASSRSTGRSWPASARTRADEPIVRAVIAMAHAMGHRVVAEGVETAVQRDWLREQGCDLAQGWLTAARNCRRT